MTFNLITRPLKIILVEPLGEINLGSIARLCENFGVDELRLVSPRCDPMNIETQKMAVHGKRFLKNACIYSNLLDAVNDCVRVVATCGRIDHGDIPLHTSKNALQWLLETNPKDPIAIIFGREDRGLSNSELQIAQKIITLKTSEKYPSLNLSHAVAIVLHEFKYYNETSNHKKNFITYKTASAKELNDCLDDVKKLLLEIGFLYDHTANARMSKIKGLLQRAEARSKDVSLIRGILRQIRWFSKKK
ncbi:MULTISPECIES: RNA methyltransferase [Prochlorococcus]|uniref:tRNA (cytidine/uridine-2'-O-)-methyltransferase TrmJ n=1 Tax=Prochlorococcus marinus (strain SARG / CCMP1375 / SS120) TaxID=167539 RepID=Q7VBF1_PROMA|nr:MULTISPECIES: RNA methyltransferase [Prochlorococcus]AAQ00189.1 rRNA methylase [Prochlorococcus marinus subsp. marinus str. CCMP1375]KGG13988.1 tRNA:Cm32/Um32 methyltransferase [Prochlorococcus marinus str. LG]KGG19121.1 tRNA:Cm32/Um32 methyltransferase [Prochlorococcus marinus str. SS2]KGG23339.1 tRNA:Cm32/Um32 methyltransferase [Prochlorococcus marinus str. SS35]KGG32425.1 tRNA:Cm32/Um32 methyltransferase [Prochlorococcus marinus str. SS51]